MRSLNNDFGTGHLKLSKDVLFNTLRRHNIIKELKFSRTNQLWVSDITYIRTIKGFCYLALIKDLHSRKIVGYDISSSIELKGCLRAINKAIYQANDIKKLIHHSESGQYCSTTYTQILQKNNIQISMTEDNHYYENAQSERINRILKGKFYLDQTFKDLAHAK